MCLDAGKPIMAVEWSADQKCICYEVNMVRFLQNMHFNYKFH